MIDLDLAALCADLRSPEAPPAGPVATSPWPWLARELAEWLVREG